MDLRSGWHRGRADDGVWDTVFFSASVTVARGSVTTGSRQQESDRGAKKENSVKNNDNVKKNNIVKQNDTEKQKDSAGRTHFFDVQ